MASKAKEPKRRNRDAPLDELVGAVMDPVLRKRGFASSEILKRWAVIAPPPYSDKSLPDRLSWPHGEETGTLHLRIIPGLRLAATHDAPKILAAVNSYFGYVLVERLSLSPSPFMPGSDDKSQVPSEPDPATRERIADAIKAVDAGPLRDALETLGTGILNRKG
ncbi:MAG: DUF721 domain-containing protein [Hyphomicrobiaceae bacterium]|nr:DUF721 domain-containing protein [Hyphomicrobiaceae bacterium]MCC0023052.1 DUF721 domain-containing protein [Hyphomicrobiaceae bacterium]